MDNPTLKRFFSDLQVQAAIDAAARRTRARAISEFFGQAWRALLSAA